LPVPENQYVQRKYFNKKDEEKKHIKMMARGVVD
jgi:hypothetical protein